MTDITRIEKAAQRYIYSNAPLSNREDVAFHLVDLQIKQRDHAHGLCTFGVVEVEALVCWAVVKFHTTPNALRQQIRTIESQIEAAASDQRKRDLITLLNNRKVELCDLKYQEMA